jgi:cysteine synthase
MDDPRSLAHSILDRVGETPLLELHRGVGPRGLRGRLLAELELFNPAGSQKDRAALEILRRAEADGALADGQTVVEPAGAAVLAGQPATEPRHKLQGAGYGRTNLALFDPSVVTGYRQVTDSEAVDAARYLAAEEGILAGFSTGANLAAAWQLLAGREAGATIAFLACDSGLKYLSTDLFP